VQCGVVQFADMNTDAKMIRKSQKNGHGVYMGCSDVSEFEHIYGQILMTPSCVYGRLFT